MFIIRNNFPEEKMEKLKYQNKFNISFPLIILAILIFTSFTAAENNSFLLSNKELKNEVINQIGRYYTEQFDVSAQNGVVTIKGEVNSLNDKYRIFDIASRVKGVKDIKDLVDVNSDTVPDQVIKQNTEETLQAASSIMEPDRIKVSVDNGVIFLDGTVSYYREKQAAQSIATWQKGAVGLQNNLKVLSHNAETSDVNLQIILTEIVSKEFPLAKNINISVKDGLATITGEVPRLSDKYGIEENFYPVLGIKGVIDNLSVEPGLNS
jgi:osmotically-inducible protein OsmY